ncbi:pyruvate formate-lyase-activating protein [Calidifontibacillus oryziterrae]|uniref:pyruvate formate-lyase-activating protein n=1 Tax=Calidifontibacillus oryziterrae TaxID=1191699 RepID=UPI0003010DB5|nr:pyruvate formate-lyase-activating protein [Calidifontibacillus oryziterrae]
MNGNVHSIETLGTVDGPGLRYVVFLQGCLLRCQFCHNADTWELGKGTVMSVTEIIDDIKSYLPFMQASGGGITVSGGEPLLQLDFLHELFKRCKSLGIHTVIDSSGGCFSYDEVFIEKLKAVLELTDLVLLDLKHIDEKKHQKLTGKSNKHILQFAKFLSDLKIPVWIRHVLVPGVTNDEKDLERLGEFIHTLNNVEKIEILPYHKLGVYKWNALGIKYPLENVEPPSEAEVEWAYQILTTKTLVNV